MKNLVLAVLVFTVGCSTHPAVNPAQYRVLRHIAVGGEGGWDDLTIDSASHRLYLSHSDRVNVIDVQSGKSVGEVGGTQGVHGIALAPALRRGFASDGRTSTITIFDLDSLATIREVKTTGDRPDAIIFDSATSRVFSFNAGGRNSTVIDAATGDVVTTIALGGKPEFARSDGQGRVYVNIEDTSEMVAIDSRGMTVAARWSLAPCKEPSGLALDAVNGRLFSSCDNKIMAVSDALAGRVIDTEPIGDGVDGGAFDPGLGLAFSSNGQSGTVTIIRESSPSDFSVVANIPTQRGARTMTLDERTHHLYLPTARFGPPPAPTAEFPHPRPSIVPGSFEILDVGP